MDIANAFSGDDQEALWRWLRELSFPVVDLLQVLFAEAYYETALPYPGPVEGWH